MGMFDYIYSDYPLPAVLIEGEKITFDSTEEFQTKDLENYLLKYTIAKDGTLLSQNGEPYDPRHNYIYRGVVDFYTSKVYGKHRYWIEYHAVFKDGILQEITPLVERLKKP